MNINLDSKAFVLMTTSLGILPGRRTPFTFKKWRSICDKLEKNGLMPNCLLSSDRDFLCKLLGDTDTDRISDLRSNRDLFAELIGLSLKGVGVYTPYEHFYPLKLKTQHESRSPLLFMYGDRSLLDSERMLAIVGTRNADDECLAFASTLGESCASNDVCVVSGGAKGIDMSAQKATIENGGSSIFVIPFGIDSTSAKKLMSELSGRYLLISHSMPESSFTAKAALERNKLVYQLADYSVIVAAHDEKGGSWSGANYAIKSGKTVFIKKSEQSAGRKLRKLGAYWIKEPEVSQIWPELKSNKSTDSFYSSSFLL